MYRLLFIGAGPAMPESNKSYVLRFEWLSKHFYGDIITPIHKEGSDLLAIGSFQFHPISYVKGSSVIRNILTLLRTIVITSHLRKSDKQNYSAVISPNPLMTGITALIISKLWNIKSIIEINGNFDDALKFGRTGNLKLTLSEKMKDTIVLWLARFSVSKCTGIKCLYHGQSQWLNLSSHNEKKVFYFHDFVPIQEFLNAPKQSGNYLLLLGFPWYLKGVDLLITAFKMISPQFPDLHLKVVGWNPHNKEYFEDLAKGNERIMLCDAVPYHEVIKLMANCKIYVLASRTEGLARVLIEAMACGKPIIASNVGGTQTIIKHNQTGLLFEKDDVATLTSHLCTVLSDSNLQHNLGQNSLTYVKAELSEQKYIDSFKMMIDSLS